MKVEYQTKDKAERLLRLILSRHDSKNQFGTLTKTFQSWKDNLKAEPFAETVKALSLYADFFR